MTLTCSCGADKPAHRALCLECSRLQRLQADRRRAALKRVGPDRVEGELARINAECDRREALRKDRLAQYDAHLTKQTLSQPSLKGLAS